MKYPLFLLLNSNFQISIITLQGEIDFFKKIFIFIV